MDDLISRQAAIDALMSLTVYKSKREIVQAADKNENSWIGGVAECIDEIEDLQSAHPDGIPLEWIDKHLEWLDNCDNDFAQLAKVGIRAMVDLWKKDRI